MVSFEVKRRVNLTYFSSHFSGESDDSDDSSELEVRPRPASTSSRTGATKSSLSDSTTNGLSLTNNHKANNFNTNHKSNTSNIDERDNTPR